MTRLKVRGVASIPRTTPNEVLMRFLPLILVGLLAATAAFADAPPPDAGPPPPPGAHGNHPPPPPPRGTLIHVDRDLDKGLRFDLHCDERESARACADIALQLVDKLNAGIQVK